MSEIPGPAETTGVIEVVTTTAEKADAQRIAAALVDRRLAACVQVGGPIESTYRWEGRTQVGAEWVCTIKTRLESYRQVEAVLRDLHPYDEPQIIALPVVAGSAGYLQWVRDETS